MIYAIGDIHGQAEMLATALNFLIQSLLEPQDMVVFMGDYVDRGPDSRGVFELLHQFRNLHGADNVVFLRGNHEDMLLTARFRRVPS